MTIEGHRLHGTRFISDEPPIDQEIFPVPAAFQVPTTNEVLRLSVIDYNRIQSSAGTVHALGRLATRTLNSFFAENPMRDIALTTGDILSIWKEYGVETSQHQTGPVLRGIDALDAIRADIDGKVFVERGARGSGHENELAITPDIVFVDKRK